MNVSVQDQRIVANNSLSGEEICAIPYRKYGSLGSTFRALVSSSRDYVTYDKIADLHRGWGLSWGAGERCYMAVIGDQKFCEFDWDYMPIEQEEFLPNPEADHRPELVHSFAYHTQRTKPDEISLWELDGAKLLQFNDSKLHGRWTMIQNKTKGHWYLRLYVHWNGDMNRKFKEFTSEDGQTWEQNTASCCGQWSEECKSWQCGWRSWLSRDSSDEAEALGTEGEEMQAKSDDPLQGLK